MENKKEPVLGASQDPIEQLKRAGVKLLSAQGAQFEVPANLRDTMCFTSDGVLTVLKGMESDPTVLAYRNRLRRNGMRIKNQRLSSVSMLRRLYKDLAESNERIRVVDSVGSASNKQIEVIRVISEAVRRGASDIHITIDTAVGTIAYRIHGDVYRVQELPAKDCVELCSTIYQSMCDIAESTYKPNVHQDARMKSEFVRRCGLFGSRIASGPTDRGSRMVIRLLYDPGTGIPTLPELGYLTEQIDLINTMRDQTSGINILSGATGSGKSTTLVSVLSQIISDARKGDTGLLKVNREMNDAEQFWGISVVTIEDPPEYTIHGANQTPLIANKSDEESIRRGWSNAIKACMRQDPDVMMIGEIRDQGSARAAFDAAMTGHGVWTTVHTTDAVGIMLRLEGLQVESDRMLDPEIVTGLINQSLAQKLCPHCSVPWLSARDKVGEKIRGRVEAYCDLENVRLRGPGCNHCNMGIIGRAVIAEVIAPNLEFMENFKREGKSAAKQYWVHQMGGITKNMALLRRINEGMVDPIEGEKKVCMLNKDKTTLGLDYTKSGDFEAGKLRIAPQDRTYLAVAKGRSDRQNAKVSAQQAKSSGGGEKAEEDVWTQE